MPKSSADYRRVTVVLDTSEVDLLKPDVDRYFKSAVAKRDASQVS